MGPKRKRAARKPVPKKPSTVGQNKGTNKKSAPKSSFAVGQREEAFLNFVNQNNRKNPRGEDSNDYEVGEPADNDIHFDGGGSSSSSSESDESTSFEDSSSDDPLTDKRSRKPVKRHDKVDQKARKLSKKDGKDNFNSPVVLHSSSRNQKKLKKRHQVSQSNKKELKASLAVIKKVMEMDEAQPFNVPVDPDALGIPDYFNLIDMPMDFGTICSNLQNNVKYMNSADVFEDVKLIWENCRKCNKKGEYIVYLVKRVKKKFMKYWTAAGLGVEQSRKPNGNLYFHPPLEYAMKHSRCKPMQIQQDRLSPNQPHMQVPPLTYNQPYQSQLPLPSTMLPPFPPFPTSSYMHPCQLQHPQRSINQLQYSQLQDCADYSGAGYSHLPPHMDFTRYNGYAPHYPTDPMVVGPSQEHPRQSPLSNGRSSEQQQLQASHENSEVSLTDSAMRGIRCALRYSAGPITEDSSKRHKERLVPTEPQPEHTQLDQNQLTQSQQPAKKMKRARGPTRCLFLRDLPKGQRITVPINKEGQPFGPESSKLSNFLGTMARNGHRAPLTFINWKEIPDSYKEDMWQSVQKNFDVDPSCKTWVLKSLAKKWRNWKTELKAKHYYPHKTDEERLKDCPPRIVSNQWPILISYWNSESAKMQCAINKANCTKQKVAHATGTKSYATILEEERRKRPDGKEPTRADLYILTHTRKDRQPVDEKSAKMIAKLREAKKQRTAECSDDSEDTFCRVIEEENSSPINSDELGPTNNVVQGSKRKRGVFTKAKPHAHARKIAKGEVSKVLEKINAVEQKYDRIESQIATLTSNMHKFLDKLGGLSNVLGSEQTTNP
ncbi:hypothetical protein SLA2020_489130 [Shorea laevis]